MKVCEDEEDAKLTTIWVDHQGLKIPVLENKDAIEAETVLLKDGCEQSSAKGSKDTQPPKKKTKKS